jgi:transposase
MHEERKWFVGIDWGSQEHVVTLCDVQGNKIGQRKVVHGGTGISDMIAWLLKASGGEPGEVHVTIETPHGPIVEALLERGFTIYSINPKQMDRFRDRFAVSGAKDDSLDADVLADSLRTDTRLFRKLSVADPLIIELREWSRIDEELKVERVRLANRLRDQLWRYYPQMLELGDLDEDWMLDLWEAAPTSEKVARLSKAAIALQRRDYHALRALCGSAPVTRRSGKNCIVTRRRACNRRLNNATFNWGRVAVQHDPVSKAKYEALRVRGHSHPRALRSVVDRLLYVACTMLENGTLFDPSFAEKAAA